MKLRPDFPRPVCAAGALWLVLAVLPFTARADGPFALTSSATNSYAFVPHNPALNAFPLTVTAWVKRSQATNSFPLVTKYDSASQNGWQVYVTNGSLRASYSDNSLISVSLDGGILRTDIWQQVAFVVNTGLAQLYVDGQLKGSLEWTGSACTNGLEMRLGCYQGALDEVSIWNVAQPPNWIATNSDRGWLGTEPGLVSYYRLNEGGGSVVIDSASGLNGIVTNGATWVSGITLRPAVMTQPPSTVTNTVATLQGSANPGVTNTSAWFEWGTSTSYGNVTAPQPLGSGASNSNFLQVLNGLTAGTTYNYRAVASNSVGISYGDNASFTTPGNSALSFDGVSSFVSVPHSIVLDPFAMTATAWIKTTQATGEVGVINKYVVGSLNGWQMFLYNGEVRAWYFGDGTHYIWDGGRGLNGGQVTNGAWHHIAFTMDGSGGKLYVDGTLKDSMLWTGVRTTCTTTQPLSFARYPGSGFFKGAIDEVTIWNLAQPPDWLFSNLDRGWVGSEPGLLAYYRLNEGTGLVASNSAPGGGVASGSLSNGPVWVAGIGLRPGLLTLTPIAVTSFGATLRGIANPENAKTTAWFEWGVSTNYGNVTSSQALGSGNENVTFSQALSGLTAGALYHYRAVASNSLGVSLGGDQLIFPGGNLAVGRAYFTLTPLPNGKVLAAGGMFTGYIPLATAELYDPASGTWSDTQPMNFPRWDHTATLLPNGRVLVTGGFSSGGGLGVPELYDPATGIWSLVASMSTNRIQHTATLLPNGKVLVAGGYSETSGGFVQNLSSAELYDPSTGTWTTTGSMSTNRILHTATLLANGKVLVAGGRAGTTYFATSELYDPATGLWSASGSLNEARALHTATLLPNGRVFAVGGISSTYPQNSELYDPVAGTWSPVGGQNTRYLHTANLVPNGQVLITAGLVAGNSADLYDPTTGTWNYLGFPASPYGHSSALLPNGKVLTAGGLEGSSTTNASYLWDTALNIFNGNLAGTNAPTGSLVIARESHTATLLTNGTVLVIGGNTNNNATAISRVELYSPATGTSATANSMSTNRAWNTTTLLPNGKVLVTGGSAGATFHASAELYNPATGLWAATASMHTNRSQHTATLLSNGKVLVAGGVPAAFASLSSAELYDPNTGTWTQTGPMNSPRSLHAAILLPSGKVLVAGGATPSGELYDPVTGTWTLTSPMTTARSILTLTLLFNGKVLAAGQGTSELYDTAVDTWTPTGFMNTNRSFHTATLLLNGRVLVTGGRSTLFSPIATAELYDPVTGTWTATGPLRIARYEHTATLLPNGLTLIAGGFGFTNGVDLATNELFDVGLGFSNSWRPQISSATSPLALGGSLALTGLKFRGLGEASGGNGCREGGSDFPSVQLRNLGSGQTLFLPSTSWQTNAFASGPVWGFPPGYALATAFVNGIPGTSAVVNVSVPAPTPPVLTGLKHSPDGSFQFGFANVVGALFGVLSTTNVTLPTSNWTAMAGVSEIAPGQFQFTDTQHTNEPRRFYGVRSP